ncbi:MAG TPA: YdeI/OmpD-associated family protein [Anaerolineaceae bacterium]|jgi:hypothetical protein|nr:YdeI/OmpD-associated family protein [Anaerolineaceae bacterium]
MSKQHTFKAKIEDAGTGGAFVTVPLDVEAVFGKSRVKVKAWIDGEPYRGSLVRMGGQAHILGIRKNIRTRIGKSIGDVVEIILQEDTEPRMVTVPEDLQNAFAGHKDAWAFFDTLSYSHQKEYVQWIEEAKKAETRQDRVQKTIRFLLEKKSRQ